MNLKFNNVEATPPTPPSIYERDGRWWWADECWQEHGPCTSQESARRRQGMYVKFCLEGELAADDPVPVPMQEWQTARNAESEGTTHPCTGSTPWDCDCSGACSCHWRAQKPEGRS